MYQLSFSGAEGQAKRKQTRREKFLVEIDKLLPWKVLASPIGHYYSKSLTDRKPYPLSAMLRIHCIQLFTIDTVPDETTILNFRNLPRTARPGPCLSLSKNRTLSGMVL